MILSQFRNFLRPVAVKFLDDLHLGKYGFLAPTLSSPELSNAKKNFSRLNPTPDKVLFRILVSDWDETCWSSSVMLCNSILSWKMFAPTSKELKIILVPLWKKPDLPELQTMIIFLFVVRFPRFEVQGPYIYELFISIGLNIHHLSASLQVGKNRVSTLFIHLAHLRSPPPYD